MDFFKDERKYLGSILKKFFNFSHISEKTQHHLTKVYTLILAFAFVCSFGVYINTAIIMNGFLKCTLSIILTVFLISKIDETSLGEV